MIVIGLTGSIGMGKSTAAAMMETLGIPVHDSDEEVHKLLGVKGKAYKDVTGAFPYARYPQIYGKKTKSGARMIKRAALGAVIFKDQKKREELESIIHPYVRDAQGKFILKQKRAGRGMAALDIPLLFETGGEDYVDCTINVSAPFHVQKARVLARPGMNEGKFHAILKRQMPDAEKCARADFVLHTGLSRAHTFKSLKGIIKEIKKKS